MQNWFGFVFRFREIHYRIMKVRGHFLACIFQKNLFVFPTHISFELVIEKAAAAALIEFCQELA